jgi:hypothetical protein
MATKLLCTYWEFERTERTAMMDSVRGSLEKLEEIGGHSLCYGVSSFSVVLVVSCECPPLLRKAGASRRRARVAWLPRLRLTSIRRWILLISGIFTLAVVIILKVAEYSWWHHRMFKVSRSSHLTAFFLLNLITIIACSGLSKFPAPTQSRIVVAGRSQRTVCHPNQRLSEG